MVDHLKNNDEALDAYERAIRFNPNFAPAYLGKGIALNNLGISGEARQAYKKARQLGYTG